MKNFQKYTNVHIYGKSDKFLPIYVMYVKLADNLDQDNIITKEIYDLKHGVDWSSRNYDVMGIIYMN